MINKTDEKKNMIEVGGEYYVKCSAHEKVVKRRVGEARADERAKMVEWIKALNEPTTNIMTVAARNEIIIHLTNTSQDNK